MPGCEDIVLLACEDIILIKSCNFKQKRGEEGDWQRHMRACQKTC